MESKMNPDKRIEWCRENIPGFKACNDQAEAARKSTEAYRQWAQQIRAQQEARAQ